MCLISGDSIVGAAPSPKLSPRPGRRCSGPRANLGSHARSLCAFDEAAASFEIDKTINNDIIEVKCLVSQSCPFYMRSIHTAFDGSRWLGKANSVSATATLSEDLAASGASTSVSLHTAAYHRDPSSNTHESVHSQPAKKSRSRWWKRPISFTLPVHSLPWHSNASPRPPSTQASGRKTTSDRWWWYAA